MLTSVITGTSCGRRCSSYSFKALLSTFNFAILGDHFFNNTQLSVRLFWIKKLVYIDDYNCVERVIVKDAPSHITTRRRVIKARANKSEQLFGLVNDHAQQLNMRVNSKKTQMLCINGNRTEKVLTYIMADGEELESTESLKILGFHFGTSPDANLHVEKLLLKAYSKLWTLRFLKKSGMPASELRNVYETVIRPGTEYVSVVYHSLIPQYLSDKLEAVQKMAMQIIYGFSIDYKKMVEDGTVELLSERRENAVVEFAKKAAESSRFGKKWFPEAPMRSREVRSTTRRKYKEMNCKTERARNNPVQYMVRKLNELY